MAWYGFDEHDRTLPGPSLAATTQVRAWITGADRYLIAAGVPAAKLDPDAAAIIIACESGGDPDRVNTWDSNARAGIPSKGLMQTTAPTFEHDRLSSLPDNIYDPVANIAAGERYAINRYGSVSNVPGVRAVRAGRAYVGY